MEEDFLSEEQEQAQRQRKMFKRTLNIILSNYFNFIVVGVFLFVLILGFFFLLVPQYNQTLKTINIINKQEKADFENKKIELKKIKDFLNSYSLIDESYKKKISLIIPTRESKEEIFSEINYLVYRNGLVLRSVSLSEPASHSIPNLPSTNGEMKKLTISLSVFGTDYEAFKNFLSAMENNLPLLDVTNLNIDPVGKSSSFLINTYYIQAPKKNS